jgi:hypothetical protein
MENLHLTSRFISYTHTHMRKILTIIGIPLCLAVAFAIGIISRPSSVPTVNAEWTPEALGIVRTITTSREDWEKATAALVKAEATLKTAKKDVANAEAAGKGADLILCAKFQARYDRTAGRLVLDVNCPLF